MISNPRWSSRQALLHSIAAVILTLGAFCRADSPYVIDVWTPYQGLPQSRVLSIAQTPDGYLWVGTKLGWLARFDGMRFVQFSPENTPAMGSPEVEKLMMDDRGVLWIADIDGRIIQHVDGAFQNKAETKPGPMRRVAEWIGRSGVENLFMTVDGALVRLNGKVVYENENNRDPKSGPFIEQYCLDGDGGILCRARGGRLGRMVNHVFKVEADQVLPPTTKVNHLLATSKGGLWIAADDGLWKREKGVYSRVELTMPEDNRQILQLAECPDGSLWLRTRSRLVLTRDGAVVLSSPLPGAESKPLLRPLELHPDSQGGIWILKTDNGVWHVDGKGKLTVLSTQNGLPSDLVEAWFEDREQNIWLGTAAGLVRLRPRWFELVETESSGPGAGVVSICEDAGDSIWLGRANGLTRWNRGVVENIPIPQMRQGIPIADVTVAPGELPGDVWLGTVPSGTRLLRGNRFQQPFPFQAAGLAIRMIRKDPEGNIWFGGEFGLFRWDGKNLRKFGPDDGLQQGHIHDISFDAKGNPWIAKAEDLLTVYQNGRFETYPLPGLSHSLWINTVLCGANGDIWLGTIGDGLFRITNGKTLRYTTEDGLPGNSVTQLIEDDLGYLWGGTLRGIFRISTESLKTDSKKNGGASLFESFGRSDGLTTSECSGGLQPACWKARDGQIWFSTSGGAVRIEPKRAKTNSHPPRVIIEEMQLNENLIRINAPNETASKVTIGAGSHRYDFDFTAINFTAPEKVRFQWKLSGIDNDWVEGNYERKATYRGIEPGDHTFSVRACNSSGVWSLESATLQFYVAPFFWQRPTVKAGFGVLGLGFGYILVAGVLRRKHLRELREVEHARSLEQQRFRHKQAMENERSRIAAELHDDIGANLTQIQWLGDAVTSAQLSTSGGGELIDRITRKSRDMVRLIDEIVWAVNPKNDTLEQLVTYVCNFAEQFFRDSPTRCRIDVTDSIPDHKLEADVRHHLFLIAKEALHNVAKHGATDRVWVRVNCDAATFNLLIEDRGAGFDRAAAEPGDGLANMQNRANLAGAELVIDSSAGKGTRVAIALKLNPKTD